MSSDVIIGHDGKPRCGWVGAGDTALGRYHDEVWGRRTHDEPALFEALTLGVFEVGLSWSIVFGKRDAFRKAFLGFDVAKVAALTARDVDRLVEDASIIRNRGKIQATVDNARAMMSASPSLVALAKSYEINRKRAPRSVADLPKSTPQAEAFAKQLKSQGYRLRHSSPERTEGSVLRPPVNSSPPAIRSGSARATTHAVSRRPTRPAPDSFGST